MILYQNWLETTAWIAIGTGVASSLLIACDIANGHRQHMKIMNLVWPLTALYSGLIGLYVYFRVGRASIPGTMMHTQAAHKSSPDKIKPLWQSTILGTTHCGSGCVLGDLMSESFLIAVPVSLFGQRMFGSWLIDYFAAFMFGIVFQYFTIKPMQHLSPREGLKAAIKADAASLTAWQLGMYGWMAIATFLIFKHQLAKTSPLFWFMMQIAMLLGFLTAYPVNLLLIKRGIKERM